jgi:hypothetical protein
MLKGSDSEGNVASPWKSRKLKAARSYAALGCLVGPVVPRSKRPPRGVKWGQLKKNRPTDANFEEWFGGSGYNVAIVLGAPSGNLHDRDFDVLSSYEEWAAENPKLARILPTAATGRDGGGRRVLFCGDPDQVRSVSPSRSNTIPLGDGELRGDGAYSVVPPSYHEKRRTYRWIVPFSEFPPFVDLFQSGLLRNSKCPAKPNRVSGVTGVCGSCPPAPLPSSGEGVLGIAGVEEAIQANVPTGFDQRRKCLWDLARSLKAIPGLVNKEPYELEPIVLEWFRRALPHLNHTDPNLSLTDFGFFWRDVKIPKGKNPLRMVFDMAAGMPVPPDIAQRVRHPQMRVIAVACRELQRVVGNGPFWVTVSHIEEYFGVARSTAKEWRDQLTVYYRLLEVVEKGCRETRKATRFRYLGQL